MLLGEDRGVGIDAGEAEAVIKEVVGLGRIAEALFENNALA
jgi:hypothetical protein